MANAYRERGPQYSSAKDPLPGDETVPYSPTQLLRMDSKFFDRLESAFANGSEQRRSASNTISPRSR